MVHRRRENCLTDGPDKILAIHSIYEPFNDIPVERSWTHKTAKSQKNQHGWKRFLYHIRSSHDHRITGLSYKEVLSQEESSSQITAVDSMNIPMLTPHFNENEPRMNDSMHNEVDRCAEKYNILVRFEKCSRQMISFFLIKEQCDIY